MPPTMWTAPNIPALLDSPIESLVGLFVAWKSLLLLVACCSPGPGYDTSTGLYQPRADVVGDSGLVALLSFVSDKLTRWDAIYFSKIANRGYLFEQEWAFGWGFTRLISFFSEDLKDSGFQYPFIESVVGIAIAHMSHALAVIALYYLTRALFPGPSSCKIAFIAGCLHILSPAGLFLSAPYGESTFALLSFLGFLLYVKSDSVTTPTTFIRDLSLLSSGIVLGAATAIRSNGLLNGLLFAEEAIRAMLSFRKSFSALTLRRLFAAGLGGICLGVGFVLPQYVAYQEFCHLTTQNEALRPWCTRGLPSIYTFIQGHYWNVGFLRYWTVSNIPLFLLALPMIAILIQSSTWTLGLTATVSYSRKDAVKAAEVEVAVIGRTIRLLRALAAPQFLLAAMALASYHVQIITRISSGYPIWYIWLASNILELNSFQNNKSDKKTKGPRHLKGLWQKIAPTIVKYMIVYGLVQAGLFSSFLPPA